MMFFRGLSYHRSLRKVYMVEKDFWINTLLIENFIDS